MQSDLFSAADQQQLATRGITLDTVRQQIRWFQQGFPFVCLQRPCTVGDGLVSLDAQEIQRLTRLHEHAARAGRMMKFVPASGAASRMFQSLLAVMNQPESLTPGRVAAAADSGERESGQFRQFLARLSQFAFFEDLRRVMARSGVSLEEALQDGRYQKILIALLTPQGLDYANLPKGLIQFHRYSDHTRTPFEEHLVEAAAYTQDASHTARVHFTVPVEHQQAIETYLQQALPRYAQAGSRYELSFSVQKPSTDTLAVDENNFPFRDQDGRLVFRPGGHGALLENLNDLHGDIIFIKNIDNVVPDHLKADTYRYKKALGGYLIALQEELFALLRRLIHNEDASVLTEAFAFAERKLNLQPVKDIRQAGPDLQRAFLWQKLNRPIRICGMVRNTGEPGGGPFWVRNANGALSLQIIESSQVDMQTAAQRAVWRSATHFNPVDLVCGVRDFRGKPFDLPQFTDPATGFISVKSKDGKALRALELPGLWNGAMAEWITVFVEVPLSTFNPVKTVYDLLRPEHQGPKSP